ncbi:recombination protein F [Mycobacterium sp. THAF192]|nr:recombination protein F [Mycobacterium sp. THAF192]
MRYTKFAFENFKGIEKMEIPLEGDVTTLIGLNESGKTTILEAIFCFSYGAEDLDAINPNLASLRDPEQWIPISKRANFNDSVRIQATVELSEEDKRQIVSQMKSEHNATIVEIPSTIVITELYKFENSRHTKTRRTWGLALKGKTGRQTKVRTFSPDGPEWQAAVKIIADRLPPIWYFPNFLFELPERFELNLDDAADPEVKDRNRFYRSTFEQILADLGYNANLDTHVVERLKSDNKSDQRSLSAVLLDMGRTITTTIFEGWNRIFGRPPSAQEVELAADSDAESPAYLELRIKGPDGYYDLSERSLGFRWFFMFLLMTSFHGKTGSSQKPLFLLDEPASNLHSKAQAELLKSFEKLLDRCSLMYTTHSHHLINLRWLDSAFVVKNSALGSLEMNDYLSLRMGNRTSISAVRYREFVSKHPDQQSYFQPVLDLLEYRPSTLEPVPNVVLVEGKSDFYLIRYMIDVIGVKREIRTVPGGGAGSLDPVIRLHIGWGKSFVVLLDGDQPGQDQKRRYETEFGPMLTQRCVLLPEVCEDAKVIEAEHLLSDSDRRTIKDAVYASGENRPAAKKALRNAVIELLARGEAVTIEASTVERFEKLIDNLNARLSEQDLA